MRVGRIAGFELRIHWSTLVIFGLVVWSLAAAQLPEQAPGAGEAAYLIAALVSGLAFYVALLAHEVSHALVARREGMEVESLTLWVLGGIAALRGEPRSPGADLRIAAVGPAVSLALAAALALLAAGVGAAGGPELVVATLGWLAGINGVLGIFNLVPAAPLDGGRILRAALWAVARQPQLGGHRRRARRGNVRVSADRRWPPRALLRGRGAVVPRRGLVPPHRGPGRAGADGAAGCARRCAGGERDDPRSADGAGRRERRRAPRRLRAAHPGTARSRCGTPPAASPAS